MTDLKVQSIGQFFR